MNKRIRQNTIIIAITALCLVGIFPTFAQSNQPQFIPDGNDSKPNNEQPVKHTQETRRKGNAWTLIPPLGVHKAAEFDTLPHNYQKQSMPSMQSLAYATTGNLGAEGQSQIYFERGGFSDFFFRDALSAWMTSATQQKFYNVYVPMTLLSYNTGGGKKTTQDRLRATFAGNVNRRIGIGANVDYLYSKGSYEAQATKDFTFGFSFYYKGDRYEAQAFYNHYNLLNKENGGITDDRYITDPEELQGGVSKIDSKNIPVRLTAAHTRVNGQEFFMNHAYNVGFWKEVQVNDTLTREEYVPTTKFIWTLDYKSSRHLFLNTNPSEAQDFWENHYMSLEKTDDNMHYYNLHNTVGIQMIEGFQKWAKFGLSAFVTHELRKYYQPTDTVTDLSPLPEGLTPLPDGFSITPTSTQNLMWVGGQIAKRKGSILTYAANAKFGIVGGIAGDIEVAGNVNTRFKLFGDTVNISAKGHFKSTTPTYLLKHYISNHFAWDRKFGRTKSVHAGGELTIPWTRTKISVNFENVQNLVYFGNDATPQQENGNVQIFAASLDQRLRFGIWNWDNTLTYQVSSNQSVLSLPTLSIYSNMYLKFTAFKVLGIQFGVDCNYYTKYYAPSYEPAIMTFHNQNEIKLGNYPFMNVYLTCKLKKVRFYLMMAHVNQGWFSNEYFSSPHYPLNPRRFQLGLSIDFAN